MSDPFIAEVIMFAGNFAPRGWALCEGQLLPISQHTAVFSLLGTTFGGDGRTTFGLPDLRGRFPMGPGNGPGLSPRRWGEKGGRESATLNVTNLPSHTHAVTVDVKCNSEDGSTDEPNGNYPAKAGGGESIYNSATNASMNAGMATATAGNTGGGQSFNIMNPFLAIYFIIALNGVFPSRS